MITYLLKKGIEKEAAGEPPPWKLIFTLQFFSISFYMYVPSHKAT